MSSCFLIPFHITNKRASLNKSFCLNTNRVSWREGKKKHKLNGKKSHTQNIFSFAV